MTPPQVTEPDQEQALSNPDWQQVVLNGGPPCFWLEPAPGVRLCFRAERWPGHLGRDPHHRFVSLADFAAQARQEGAGEERKAIAKWLRAKAQDYPNQPLYWNGRAEFQAAALVVEHAAHLAGEEETDGRS